LTVGKPTRQIKSDPDIKHIPIIGLTAHAMVGDRDKAIQAGCNDYAQSQSSFEKLVGLINRLIGV